MTDRMWGGRFDAAPSQLLKALNDSFAFDRELFTDDIQGSIAWAEALTAAGVLTPTEGKSVVEALHQLAAPT
ncbi:MAG: argininosuccinate lyase, partial [Thermoanaerobaculia bacterium]